MNMKKFILLGVLLAPGAGYATPATLTVLTPVTVSTAQVFNSSVTVDVGTASVLGGADYTLTFDTHVVSQPNCGTISSSTPGHWRKAEYGSSP